MEQLNDYFIDSYLVKFLPLRITNSDNLSNGQYIAYSVNYHPSKLLDIGLFVNYQYSKFTSDMSMDMTNEIGAVINQVPGLYSLRTGALGIGISNTWYVSHLLKFQEKESSILRNMHFGIEMSGGVAMSGARSEFRFDPPLFTTYDDYYVRSSFQSQVGVKIEYSLTKTQIYSAVGLRAGYQFFKTGTLQTVSNEDWLVFDLSDQTAFENTGVPSSQPMNLDFSGLYVGAYLRLGR